MALIQEIERTGNIAVKKLRLNKLQKGHPFMINSKELPPYQCYLEYPDGSISLVSLSDATKDFVLIKKLSHPEEIDVRSRFNLPL